MTCTQKVGKKVKNTVKQAILRASRPYFFIGLRALQEPCLVNICDDPLLSGTAPGSMAGTRAVPVVVPFWYPCRCWCFMECGVGGSGLRVPPRARESELELRSAYLVLLGVFMMQRIPDHRSGILVSFCGKCDTA